MTQKAKSTPLSSQYLGFQLEHPLVPSASPLSKNLDLCYQLEDAGASALVLYSLFEEELDSAHQRHIQLLHERDLGHSEASHFLPLHRQPTHALEAYLEQIQRLKQRLNIPVIASLNGISRDGWIENARLIEEAGADALELNIYALAADPHLTAEQVEAGYLDLIRALRHTIQLPIVVKLSPFFSALAHFVVQLEQTGIQGIALFNRFYQPDIDPDSLRVSSSLHLSTSVDTLLPMRWLGILYGKTGLSLAGTGGVHSSEDAVKFILAGADVVHLCSLLLKQGPQALKTLRQGLEQWLEMSPYDTLEQARGVLSHHHSDDPSLYERASYVQLLSRADY